MNKIYKLVVTDDAAEDIENIYHFIALHSPKAADRLKAEFIRKLESLKLWYYKGHSKLKPS